MRTQIGGMNNVKIFVLYLMRNINYPLNYATINDIVRQTDYIMFLDFAVAFYEMLDGDLIKEDGKGEEGEPLYSVTEKGSIVAEQLHSDILPSILEHSLSAALRYLDFRRRNIKISTDVQPLDDKTFDVILTITEQDKVIMNTKVNVDSEYRAQQMRENFRSRPEVIFRGTIALLSGKMDYLFN